VFHWEWGDVLSKKEKILNKEEIEQVVKREFEEG